MTALLDLQRAFAAQMLGDAPPGDALQAQQQAPALLGAWPADPDSAQRLAIYRNTCLSTLVSVLRLSFPAVARLVGAEFFEAGARDFIRHHRPASAYLNDYGAEFPEFLSALPSAAGLAYLGAVAQLEWAVNRALHAEDVPGLDLARLSSLDASALSRVSFRAHPGLGLLCLPFPADAIWRAVLDQNDAAMAAIDLESGPVHLLIERDAAGVQVRRLEPDAWRFIAQLCAGRPLFAMLDDGTDSRIKPWLADQLASGRLIDFHSAVPSEGDPRP